MYWILICYTVVSIVCLYDHVSILHLPYKINPPRNFWLQKHLTLQNCENLQTFCGPRCYMSETCHNLLPPMRSSIAKWEQPLDFLGESLPCMRCWRGRCFQNYFLDCFRLPSEIVYLSDLIWDILGSIIWENNNIWKHPSRGQSL